MKREHLIRPILIVMIVLVILANSLFEGGHDYWSYACYALIAALAVYTIASGSVIKGDPTTRKRRRLMLGLGYLTVITIFSVQYLQIQ